MSTEIQTFYNSKLIRLLKLLDNYFYQKLIRSQNPQRQKHEDLQHRQLTFHI